MFGGAKFFLLLMNSDLTYLVGDQSEIILDNLRKGVSSWSKTDETMPDGLAKGHAHALPV